MEDQTATIERLYDCVAQLRAGGLALEASYSGRLDAIPEPYRISGRNLLHYLTIRHHDLRDDQVELADLGLSSLGRMEAHVQATLDAVAIALAGLAGALPPEPGAFRTGPATMDEGRALLTQHAGAALGPSRSDSGRVMVTMPSEAADDPAVADELLRAGMTIMRVNTAHDDPDRWGAMVANLRRASAEHGHSCKVSFDLAGPKLRTGSLGGPLSVAKWKPRRDDLGVVIRPARVILTPDCDREPVLDGTVVPTGTELVGAAQVGDVISLHDARGRSRDLVVRMVTADSVVATSDRTGYVTTGTELTLERGDEEVLVTTVGELPDHDRRLHLERGDTLRLTLDQSPGAEAEVDELGRVVQPARIACTLPEVFESVRRGQRIILDDGAIEGTVTEVRADELRIEITAPGSGTLKADKGINLPDTELPIMAFTDEDRRALARIVGWADLVAMSFVNSPEEILALQAELDRLGADHVGLILKIETRLAFENLPLLLLTALRRPPVAVMVARGDLAVELGYERLAEAQEEILWLCEAAHVPVIWATQVLESLAKEGAPSRAEITDAAWATRAECVMLNKGPHIDRAITFLRDLHRRMADHQRKRTGLLRPLSLSRNVVS
jgi:pyruvate kinase